MTDTPDETPPAPFIIAQRVLRNEHGHEVIENQCISGTLPEDYPQFIGRAAMRLTPPGHPPHDRPFEFRIPADTPERAFALFASCAQARGDEITRELTKPRIEVASGLDPSLIQRPLT